MPQIEKQPYVWIVKLPARNLYTLAQVQFMLDLAQISINSMYETINEGVVFVLPTNRMNAEALEINARNLFGEIEYVQNTQGE